MKIANPRIGRAKGARLGIAANGKGLKKPEGDEKFARLQVFMRDWMSLRLADHAATRLQLRREELEWRRANSQQPE